jgi:MFS family permease
MTSASTPAAHLPAAMGQLYASASAGRLVGPALGGFLAETMPFRRIFMLVGVLTGIGFILVMLFLKEPPRPPRTVKPSVRANWKHVRTDLRLQMALGGMLLSMSAIGMQMPVFPLYVEDLLPAGRDAAFFTGIGFAVVAAFTLTTAPFLGRITARFGLKRALLGAFVVVGAALALHPACRTIPEMLAVRALLGIGAAGIQPTLHSMISREAPEGMRGGITGWANSASILGFFVGPLAAGWLAGHVGTTGVFEIAAALVLGCAFGAAVFAKRSGRSRDVVPVPAQAP